MKNGKELDIVKEVKGDSSYKSESRGAVIPVCLGEFDHKDVEAIKELWERTWSADLRSKKR